MHIHKAIQPAPSSPTLLLITCVTRRISRGSFHSTDQAKSPFPLSLCERLFIESAHLCSNCWWCVHKVVDPKCLTSNVLRYDKIVYSFKLRIIKIHCGKLQPRYLWKQVNFSYNMHFCEDFEEGFLFTDPWCLFIMTMIFLFSRIHQIIWRGFWIIMSRFRVIHEEYHGIKAWGTK